MLVNTIDIITYKAKLLNKNIQTAEITIYDDWLRKALLPLYLGKQETFKSIKMQFVIADTTNNDCLEDISNFISQLAKCIVKFDDVDFYYNCTLVSKEHSQLIETGYFGLDVELKSGYAYTAEVTETINHTTHIDINTLGNLPSPARVTITPSINIAGLTITGFETAITIYDLLANVSVIIDGELCTILQNGSNKFGDVDLWSFPVLLPRPNTIAVDNTNCVVTIKYKPKYV